MSEQISLGDWVFHEGEYLKLSKLDTVLKEDGLCCQAELVKHRYHSSVDPRKVVAIVKFNSVVRMGVMDRKDIWSLKP